MTNHKLFMLAQRLTFFYTGLVLGLNHEEIASAGLPVILIVIGAYSILAAIFIFSESMVKQ